MIPRLLLLNSMDNKGLTALKGALVEIVLGDDKVRDAVKGLVTEILEELEKEKAAPVQEAPVSRVKDIGSVGVATERKAPKVKVKKEVE